MFSLKLIIHRFSMQTSDYIQKIIEGIDPASGISLRDGSCTKNPLVQHALEMVLQELRILESSDKCDELKRSDSVPENSEIEKRFRNIEAGRQAKHGFRWTVSEKNELKELFLDGGTFGDLAKIFERSYGAILFQIQQLGLISEEEFDNSMRELYNREQAVQTARRKVESATLAEILGYDPMGQTKRDDVKSAIDNSFAECNKATES